MAEGGGRGKAGATYIIGIAGPSCSGKTALASLLAERLGGAVLIHLDSYYRDLAGLDRRTRARVNFDLPEALDLELFEKDLGELSAGGDILVPSYNFKTHMREDRSRWTPVRLKRAGRGKRFIVVEGLHALYLPEVRELLDLGVFLDASAEVCLSRRMERDMRERGRTRAQVAEQFEKTVIPMYALYVLPVRDKADLVLDGEDPLELLADRIVAAIGPFPI